VCLFFLLYVDKLVKHYYDNTTGVEQNVSSATQPCVHIVKSPQDRWLRIWFESINISSGNFLYVVLKNSSENTRMFWNLTSNDPKRLNNFDALDEGDWFEITQTTNVSFDLRFMSYSGSAG
jgi:hypothetical protein